MTDDFSYGSLTLELKDQREAKLFYQSRLDDIADTYWAMILINVLAMIVYIATLILEGNAYYWIVLVLVTVALFMRVICYFMRA